MSKLLCKCGEVISDNTESNTNEHRTFSQPAFWQTIDRVASAISSFFEADQDGEETRTKWLAA